MILHFWILAIAFSGPMQCPDRGIDILMQRCKSESPELFFYLNKDKAIADYSALPSSADSVRLYKAEISWPKNRFSDDFSVDIYSMELRPVKSYEVKISTRALTLWR